MDYQHDVKPQGMVVVKLHGFKVTRWQNCEGDNCYVTKLNSLVSRLSNAEEESSRKSPSLPRIN